MRVRLPNGTVIDNVPEGTSRKDLAEKLTRNGMQVPADWLSSPAPSPTSSADAAQSVTQEMGTGERLLVGAGRALSEPIEGAKQLWQHISGASPEELRQFEAIRKENERLYAQGPGKTTAGKVGYVGGEIAKALPALLTGTSLPAMAASGAGGAMLSPVSEDKNFLAEKAKQAGMGAAIGGAAKVGGDVLAKGIPKLAGMATKSLTSETAQDAAKQAQQMGYKIMAGQQLKEGMTAKTLRKLEGSTGNVARQNQEKLNSDILKEFGVMGKEINDKTISKGKAEADRLFNLATSGKAVHLDSGFRDALNGIIQSEQGKVPSLQAQKLLSIAQDFQSRIPSVGAGHLATVKVPPKTYQEMRSSLGDLAQSAMQEGNYNLSRKYKALMAEMDGSAERYMKPDEKKLWQEARQKWRLWSVLRDASNSGAIVKGDINPNAFAKLIREESDTAWATGGRTDKLFQLAKMIDSFPNAFSGNIKSAPAEGIAQLAEKGLGAAGTVASYLTKPIVGGKRVQQAISNPSAPLPDSSMIQKGLLGLGIGTD